MIANNMVNRSLYLAVFWLGFLLPAPSAFPADIHQTVRSALVSISIKAETDVGTPLAVEGTGFLVSDDGYILTSYHLLAAMAKAKEGSIEIRISVGEKKPDRDRTAFVVDANPYVDVLMLKTPTRDTPFPYLKLGTSRSLQIASDPIFTAGFPATLPFVVVATSISSFDGPGGHTWTLSNAVDAGQSGSPVYRASGEVVGIVKGMVGAQAAFVPIDLAGGLAGQYIYRVTR
jgi:putative serine protease PepD